MPQAAFHPWAILRIVPKTVKISVHRGEFPQRSGRLQNATRRSLGKEFRSAEIFSLFAHTMISRQDEMNDNKSTSQ